LSISLPGGIGAIHSESSSRLYTTYYLTKSWFQQSNTWSS